MTGKTEATASSFEMDEDDIFLDFKYDDAQTQPYLSLGLTPLSQLSPPDPGPTSSVADSYFFPSMPPPVTPISSVFSINGSNSNPGISVDSPFQIQGAGMVMPEANPPAGEPTSTSRRTGRRNKHETSNHSQPGYAMKLEPVLEAEQSCSLENNVFAGPQISSSSSAEDPNYSLLQSSETLPSHLCRKTAKRRKSGTRRKMEEGDDDESKIIQNSAFLEVIDFPVKLSREENSPRQEGRRLRQKMREEELSRQKEKLRQKQLQEERARLLHHDQRAAKIMQDYGSSQQHKFEGNLSVSSHSNGMVLEQAMRFEAQAQFMKDTESSSPGQNHSRQTEPVNSNNVIVSTSNQFSVL